LCQKPGPCRVGALQGLFGMPNSRGRGRLRGALNLFKMPFDFKEPDRDLLQVAEDFVGEPKGEGQKPKGDGDAENFKDHRAIEADFGSGVESAPVGAPARWADAWPRNHGEARPDNEPWAGVTLRAPAATGRQRLGGMAAGGLQEAR